MAKIFWVEDRSHWIDKFQDPLERADLDGGRNEVLVCKFSEAARQKIALMSAEDRPDIALLDARMNGNDRAGFSVSAALLNKWPGLPIIFFSVHSGTGIEKDAFSEHRIADFIAKHQHNVEEVLCWRMRAVLRHKAVNDHAANITAGGVLRSGDLTLDLDTWEVYWQGGRLMNLDNPKRPLAPTPRKILRCLVERSPRPGICHLPSAHQDPTPLARCRRRGGQVALSTGARRDTALSPAGSRAPTAGQKSARLPEWLQGTGGDTDPVAVSLVWCFGQYRNRAAAGARRRPEYRLACR